MLALLAAILCSQPTLIQSVLNAGTADAIKHGIQFSLLLAHQSQRKMHNHASKTCFYLLCRTTLFASLTDAPAAVGALRSQLYDVKILKEVYRNRCSSY